MHSLTTAPSFSSLSFHFFPHRHRHHHTLFQLTPPFIFSFQYTTAKRLQVQLHVQEEKSLRKKKGRKGLCCKEDLGGAEEEVFSPLEAEILEFMRSSTKPSAFPTREELVAAGRVDLIDAIVTKECYLVYGWDLDRGSRESYDFDGASVAEIHGQASMASGFSSSSDGDNSCKQAKSMDIEVEESGIEGILNRLERQRSNSFGLGLTEKDESDPSRNSEDKDTVSTLHGGLIKLDQHRSQLGSENLRNSLEPDTWRSWIIQRNGSSNVAFEAAEIVPSEIGESSAEPANREAGFSSLDGDANHTDIKSRIRNLESELSSALHSLRSKADYVTMQMDQKNSSDDLAKYSDAWEFQETEIMNAQDRLRSIRAKLSVLEGKKSLAIMDAHKIVEEKQKRINNAHRALQTLKTICVVWHNPSSQIYLVGSFDGWSTQRKMEKSNTGIFSLNLLLYPGKYEIKFIVDGEWKVDPLLPIVVTNKGYENNLLVVHD
ncbi:protein PTST homolog 2, chloroplastic-like isoform X1 [Arachis stenosperma]|uniref:protein PTST homolog 2, chloroplastic-like isoform X1 n=1 Tax=Arachis stenosperma TaxID=217475 RepID=UPI0025AD8F19|nr:protein PTST homolog 2, chloroplastic-like isoform X1 [Arachis stenosperma]